jgi:HEAT repeat protein
MPTPPRKGKPDLTSQLLDRLLNDDDLDDHFAARESLAGVSGAAREALVDAVVDAATGRTPRTAAIGVLGDLGGERAVAALVELCAHRDEEVREEAVTALGHLGDRPAAAVPALVQALSDANEDIRDQAADALAEYASPVAIEPLLSALAKARAEPRWQQDVRVGGILEALASSGPEDPRVVDTIAEHLTPDARAVAGPAFEALVHLGKRGERARPALERVAAGADAWTSLHAHRALIALGDDPDKHVPAIVDSLVVKDAESGVAAAASNLLLELGPVARPFVDAAAKGKNAALRKVAERIRAKMATRR